MATNELSLKLLIDIRAQKVCFAEAGNDVVEFLSILLCLPVSTITSLLTKERMVGSIGNVLDSLQELDTKYVISSTRSKKLYVSPAVAPSVLHPLQPLLDVPLNVSDTVVVGGKNNHILIIHVYRCQTFACLCYDSRCLINFALI